MQTRGSWKKLYPGGYNFSVSGQVAVGESYEDAFKRETQEELNFNPDDYRWREVQPYRMTSKRQLGYHPSS